MTSRRVVYQSLQNRKRWFSAIRHVEAWGIWYEDFAYFDNWGNAMAYALKQGRAA